MMQNDLQVLCEVDAKATMYNLCQKCCEYLTQMDSRAHEDLLKLTVDEIQYYSNKLFYYNMKYVETDQWFDVLLLSQAYNILIYSFRELTGVHIDYFIIHNSYYGRFSAELSRRLYNMHVFNKIPTCVTWNRFHWIICRTLDKSQEFEKYSFFYKDDYLNSTNLFFVQHMLSINDYFVSA